MSENNQININPLSVDPAQRLEAELAPLLDGQPPSPRQIEKKGDLWWSSRQLVGVLPLQSEEDVALAMDPWALEIIGNERNRYRQFTWPFSMAEALKDTLASYRTRYDYFLVGPVESSEHADTGDDRENARQDLATQVVRAWREGKLGKIGLKLIGTVGVDGSGGPLAWHYTLLLVRLEDRI